MAPTNPDNKGNNTATGDVTQKFSDGNKVDEHVVAQETNQNDKLHRWLQKLNSMFQHFHSVEHGYRNEELWKHVDQCEKCVWVSNCLLSHDPEKRKLVKSIRQFHKNICQIIRTGGTCQLCAQETVTNEITQIKTTPLKKGMEFEDGEDYVLEKPLGKGGNGEVLEVKLLPGGKLKLGVEDDNLLAAKIANVSKNEMKVLQQLAECPHIAIHYFIVDKCQIKLWKNRKIKGCRDKEPKRFKHLLFMKRACKSLCSKGVLPLSEASIYFYQVCQAVQYSHSLSPPIVHNDIKSANVLLGNDGHVYLTDYEFAIELREGCPPAKRGTRFFMAPEEQDSTAKDIYSLGVFFLELTIPKATCLPEDRQSWDEFKNRKVSELTAIHKEIGLLIGACIHHNPKKRPSIEKLAGRFNEIGRREGWWDESCPLL